METGPAFFDPTPLEGSPPVGDPFDYMAFPAVGACTETNFSSTGDVTLDPGVYCGGISITGTGTATFTTGDYFIKDGELTVAGTMIALTGAGGVTFFMTGAAANANFVGTADIGLTALAGGTYGGFLFFGDKNNPATSPHIMRGTELGGYNGMTYLPGAQIRMVGTADGVLGASDCAVLIADTIVFYGTPIFEAAKGCSDYGGVASTAGATIVQ